eukprot:CAMPEP_0184695308 /NCGR_PEP_ID=MMETSP0313-20130426/2986_1 /TAXON_ID=2792 /ORGANISM="Porphyridium aerugineum, Strain SAG 1380-2" /LENGTH=1117 /DNA_ID=CAMNT_0027153743 /DNA_START=54 /DNA_END=3407 /DNA_ORIENTATION=-
MRFFEVQPKDPSENGSTSTHAKEELVASYSHELIWDGKCIGHAKVDAVRIEKNGGKKEKKGGVEDEAVVDENEQYGPVIVTKISVNQSSGGKAMVHLGVNTNEHGDEWVSPMRLYEKMAFQTEASMIPSGDQAVRIVMDQEVTISIMEDSDVTALVFCVFFKNGENEQWFAGPGGRDFKIKTGGKKKKKDGAASESANGLSAVGAKICALEGEPDFSTPRRFGMIMEYLDEAAQDPDVMAWLFVVMRYHNNRKLRWYSKHNYQSKDMGHMQDTLSNRVSQVALFTGKNYQSKRFARMIMPYLSRGGGQSEAIRMEILSIMRKHGIKEGHRPGIDDKFLEQWHQKLHQHTTKDDIVICKAYLSFLHSGNIGDFWHTLWEKGGLTREMMASWPNPIRSEPFHLPQMIPDMKHYLWILTTVHGGADLGFITESSKWALEKYGDNQAVGYLYEIMSNYHEWWIPGKIAETRVRIEHPMYNVLSAGRDLLLLDAALESAFKNTTERTDPSGLSRESLIDIIEMVLGQSSLSRFHNDSFETCVREWRSIVKEKQNWSDPMWGIRALAICDKVAVQLATETADLVKLLQPKAEALAKAAHIEESFVTNFSEEVVRAQPSFLVSVLMRYLVPHIRGVAGVGPWQVVSVGQFAGMPLNVLHGCQVLDMSNLADIQGQTFTDSVPRLVLANAVDGNCDIPLGIDAVVSASTVDVLSHVAIRARNQEVLLVCCDESTLADLRVAAKGKDTVNLVFDKAVGSVHFDENAKASGSADKKSKSAVSESLTIRPPAKLDASLSAAPLLTIDQFTDSLVGGKSYHLFELRSRLPSWLHVPNSIAFPFGVMELCLADSENKAVVDKLASLLKNKPDAKELEKILVQVRKSVEENLKLNMPVQTALQKACETMNSSGEFDNAALQNALGLALKAVWASKWTYRAYLSRQARNIPDSSLYMAVLVQPVVKDAEFAFVLHTKDPLSGDSTKLFGELVWGLGESLVGSFPGRALSFVADKATCKLDKVMSFPSKPMGFFASTGSVFVRSDSNGEDLEKFAGAGLYDSVACGLIEHRYVDYTSCRLFTDPSYLDELVSKLTKCGVDVENVMTKDKVAQDIEGVVDKNGEITVVQSRPQI